jgi:CDP-glucose 4,6-dehydratase
VEIRKGTLEDMELKNNFWKDKKVFITGHTGFKGSWLCIMLVSMGAKVTGYALNPPTEPSLFKDGCLDQITNSIIGDIRDKDKLKISLFESKPDILIHMAAQPLVRYSYHKPVETYETNVMGTVYLLEAVRQLAESGHSIKAVVNVTTDKCYENKEWVWGYRENEPMGGYDPYSNSKACSELVTSAYRNSYFNISNYSEHGVALASARAGNVIGGGDWAEDRLIPDCVRSLMNNKSVIVRNPDSIRPWQHVLEPLSGYLLLAEKLFTEGAKYAEAWNFGPEDTDARPVKFLVEEMCAQWGQDASYLIEEHSGLHEAHYLKLDCSKSNTVLGWFPRWSLEKSIEQIVNWTRAYLSKEDIRSVCYRQIEEYFDSK